MSLKGPRHIARNLATTIATPGTITLDLPRPGLGAAHELVFVGLGKYHIELLGSSVPPVLSPEVVCAVAAAGPGVVKVRTPHSTSLPEYVSVRDTSVGPVVLSLVKPDPKDEYSVHVAAVVEAS